MASTPASATSATCALPRESLRPLQALIVGAHEGAVGDAAARAVVRAAMATRLNGIARGGSGASRQVAQAFVDLLNARVHPVVPATGSIGASDLMHMAAIAQVFLGAVAPRSGRGHAGRRGPRRRRARPRSSSSRRTASP